MLVEMRLIIQAEREKVRRRRTEICGRKIIYFIARFSGMDGWIRVWFYETIDHAYSHDGDNFLEIQPIYEYHIGESEVNGSMLMCIRKQEPDSPESTLWYAQVSDESR